MKKGEYYYFWDTQKQRLGKIHIIKCMESTFLFTYGKGRGECEYKAVEGKLFMDPWDVPEYRKTMSKQQNADDGLQAGFDNMVGFEHSDLSGTGYKYYPSIYYYQGSDDSLSHGSIYDVEEYYDSYDN